MLLLKWDTEKRRTVLSSLWALHKRCLLKLLLLFDGSGRVCPQPFPHGRITVLKYEMSLKGSTVFAGRSEEKEYCMTFEEEIREGFMEERPLQLAWEGQSWFEEAVTEETGHPIWAKWDTKGTYTLLSCIPTWIPGICWLFPPEMVSFLEQEHDFYYLIYYPHRKPLEIK